MGSVEAERFRATLELHALGVTIQRQNIRRRHPHADDDEVDEMVERWLDDRPVDYSPE